MASQNAEEYSTYVNFEDTMDNDESYVDGYDLRDYETDEEEEF